MSATARIAALAALLYTIPSAIAETIPVTVGGDGIFAYDPPYVTAHAGDVVQFNFQVKNHTATQSTFDTPCSPLSGGFDTGFKPVSPGQTDVYSQYQVTDMNPVWFYCKQGDHCNVRGMVFAINPGQAPAPNTFEAFQAKATGGAAPPSGSSTSNPYPGYPSTSTAPTDTTAAPPSASASAPAPSGGAGGNVHLVQVGLNGNSYSPNQVTANVGDTVVFQFMAKNHTVTQSSLSNPCRKLEFTTPQIGFDSGFNFAVPAGTTQFPTFNVTVNDTNPIYGYCRQTNGRNHCGDDAMVFLINGDAATFQQLQETARRLNGTGAGSGSASPSPTRPASAMGRASISVTALLTLVAAGAFLL